MLEKCKYVLWFEDDKYFNKNPKFEKIDSPGVFHFWMKVEHPTFHPTLWSTVIFEDVFVNGIVNSGMKYDPELLMKSYWQKMQPKPHLVSYGKKYVSDIGRKWQQDNNIKKWKREHTKNVSITYV
jgi:hypothetical protein